MPGSVCTLARTGIPHALRRAGQPQLRAPALGQARQLGFKRCLEQPVLRQETGAGRDEVRALRQRRSRQPHRVRGRIRQRLHPGERGGEAPRGHEEPPSRARLDQSPRDEALVGVHDGEGTRAYLLRQAPDRGQACARDQLALANQLAHALADLLDQRHGGFATELEHRGGNSYFITITMAVAARLTAMTTLNTMRGRGAARKFFSELPKSAQAAMHGTPTPSITPAM